MSAMFKMPTRVKICGLTRPEDAELAAELGADFVGLNFWDGSIRFLDLSAAREIADAVRGARRDPKLVGVFVNRPADEVRQIEAEVGLDLVQFHGDEGPEDIEPFAGRAIKALRFVGEPDPEAFAAYRGVWGFLVEARHAETYGGGGLGWNYAAARSLAVDSTDPAGPAGPTEAGRRLLIAGGLGPENVRSALAASNAWGVDVASGVEAAPGPAPGAKDRDKLERFFAEVRLAEQR